MKTNLTNLASQLGGSNGGDGENDGDDANPLANISQTISGLVNQAAHSAAVQGLGQATQQSGNDQSASQSAPGDSERTRNEREHAATLSASVISMLSRPTADGTSEAQHLDPGINANITINAQVSPNITIRIIPQSLGSKILNFN